MVDTILYAFLQVLPYLTIVSFILIVVKTYLFVSKKSASWKPQDFFYFTYRHVEMSYSNNGKRNKMVQNFFSIAIFILLLLAVFGLLIKKKLEG